jgi:lysophospholipase L1-like esterase
MNAWKMAAVLTACALGAGQWAAAEAARPETAQPAAEKPLPRVLIIGDSISLGYMATVVQALEGKAIVEHNQDPNNAGSTERGVANIDKWLGSNQWDVIHFNWGLWDINRRVNGKRNVAGPIAATPEEFEARLDKLVARLKQTRAKLVWAPMTYCTGGWGRVKGDDVTYNAVAAGIMKKYDVPIDDLHALTSTFPPELFKSPGNVHFSDEGYRKIGQQVAAAIEKALKDR